MMGVVVGGWFWVSWWLEGDHLAPPFCPRSPSPWPSPAVVECFGGEGNFFRAFLLWISGSWVGEAPMSFGHFPRERGHCETLWDGDAGGSKWWLTIGLVVFYRTPPLCPPRSPSPWPSPAERERETCCRRARFCNGLARAGGTLWGLGLLVLDLRLEIERRFGDGH